MSIPDVVTAARAALAHRLRDLRGLQGWSLAQAATRIGYHKSSVSRAEHDGIASRDYLAAADQLYRTANHELATAHDRIEALRAAARAEALHKPAAQPGPATAAEQASVAFAALEAHCPHCRKPVAVVLEHSALLVTAEATKP